MWSLKYKMIYSLSLTTSDSLQYFALLFFLFNLALSFNFISSIVLLDACPFNLKSNSLMINLRASCLFNSKDLVL